jgi:hypothetical protein
MVFSGFPMLLRAMMRTSCVSLVALTIPSRAAAAPPEEGTTTSDGAGASSVRRFALLVGADDGGPDRDRLRYSSTDARALGETLSRLGGLRPDDMTRLSEPTPTELRGAFGAVAAAAARAHDAGEQVQFVFYYSGHSDDRSLLIGGPRLEYKELRRLVNSVPADVHIAILDSCASGGFTRTKGGQRRPPFLIGDAAEVEGHAYLTSASADESAQESDTVGGSFFTHFLNSGLRGAADIDGDDKVTLDEAYRFAYDQTLRRTESTRAGAQHAAYEIDLSGSGDLVMTDLRLATAKLEIASQLGGRVYVRDDEGRLHAELEKVPGAPAIVLALPPGVYRVTLDDGRQYLAVDVTLSDTSAERVDLTDFSAVDREDAQQKGEPTELFDRPVEASLIPSVSLADGASARQRNRLAFGLAGTRNAELDGVMLTLGWNETLIRARGVQMAMGANLARGQMRGLQLSVGYNQARQLRGAQAGFINVSSGSLRPEGVKESEHDPARGAEHYSRGLQIGALNLSSGSFDGLQLGLINVADDASSQFGLISYDRRGGVHPHVSTNELALVQVDLRFSARKTYTFLTWGIHPLSPGAGWNAGLGLGGRVRFGAKRRLFVDMDVTLGAVLYGLDRIDIPAGLLRARLMLGFQAFRHLSFYGGATGSLLVDHPLRLRVDNRPGFDYLTTDVVGNSISIRGWPGFVVGVGF